MNLAHVERYFADFLSGMESGENTLPNLVREADGWRIDPTSEYPLVPIPNNLFVAGTVNIDETTYSFSPKVLDRAQTIEFRVATSDLSLTPVRPSSAPRAGQDYLAEFLAVARDPNWHVTHRPPGIDHVSDALRRLHELLSEWGLEFGHRTNLEAVRFASIYAALGRDDWQEALDLIVMQKILPRIHGARARVEDPLKALEGFCREPSAASNGTTDAPLRLSHDKVRRMLQIVQRSQFVSFTE